MTLPHLGEYRPEEVAGEMKSWVFICFIILFLLLFIFISSGGFVSFLRLYYYSRSLPLLYIFKGILALAIKMGVGFLFFYTFFLWFHGHEIFPP